MAYSVGPGVKKAIDDYKDEPRSNETYVTDEVSVTYGRDAIYVYYKEDNRTNRLPFER